MEERSVYDENHNYIGKDVYTTDKDGRTHITHYDKYGNRVGESYETTDWRGEEYIVHEDADGKTIARSEVMRDFWGDYYLSTTETAYGRERREEVNVNINYEKDTDGAIFDTISALLKVLLFLVVRFVLFLPKLIPIFFGYVMLPLWVCTSGIGLICACSAVLISVYAGGISVLVYPLFAVFYVVFFSFIPYWIILIIQRFKKRMTWRDVLSYYYSWYLKGPFAYPQMLAFVKKRRALMDSETGKRNG